jgi:hypothetical protein
MINFRFHIASLVAVFLALALGIVIGSTVIDRAIVDNLNDRLDDIEREAGNTRAENRELDSEIERLESYIDATKSFAVRDRLDNVPVVPLAVRGIDEEQVAETVALAQDAGAEAPGILWLEEKLALTDEAAVDELAGILGIVPSGRRPTRDALWGTLAGRLTGDASSTGPGDGDLLAALQEAGFVQFQAVGEQPDDPSLADFPGPGARVLLVGGTDANLRSDATVAPLARALRRGGTPLVVGEVYREEDGGPERGAYVASIRDDDELATTVSTVDDLDFVQGRVAAILALSDLASGAVGHYGYGAGADDDAPDSGS